MKNKHVNNGFKEKKKREKVIIYKYGDDISLYLEVITHCML